MKRVLTVLTFLLLSYNTFAVTIYLREMSYAHGNFIELREIAFVQGANAKKWENLVVGKTSKKPQALTAAQIKQLIDSSIYTEESYTIIGNKTTVITPFTKITQFELETEVKRSIKKLFPTDWKRTYLLFTQDMGDVEIPLGNYQINVSVKNSDVVFGRKNVNVQIFLDGRLYKTLSTSLTIQGRVRVLFAIRAILPGQPVRPYDVMFNEIVLEQDLSEYVFSTAELNGMMSRKYIPQGSPLIRSSLKKRILVHASQDVEMVYRNGSVVVFADGISQVEGGLGDIVTVKSKFNNRVFRGKVIGEGKVEIGA